MRTLLTISAIAQLVLASGQQQRTGTPVASMPTADAGLACTRQSSRPIDLGVRAPSPPAKPEAPGVVRWEFGDGSVSRILPPRPWRPSDRSSGSPVAGPPMREHCAGSPCVAASEAQAMDDDAKDPRPNVIEEGGGLVLVTYGLGTCYLSVLGVDLLGRPSVPEVRKRFASGRWSLDPQVSASGAIFITVQDLATGDRWRAGIAL